MNAKRARQRRAEENARLEAQVDQRLRRTRLIKLLAVAVIALAAVVTVVIVATSGGGEKQLPPAQQTSLLAGIPQNGEVLGREDAPVTVTEFADLQCPFCARYSNEVLPSIIRDYVRPGKIKLRQQLLTFIGDDSREGALAAYSAAQQNKMFDFTGAFFAKQQEENSGYVTPGFIKQIAKDVPGLDQARFDADQGKPEAARMLQEATRNADTAKVSGTPAFMVSVRGGAPVPLQVNDLTVSAFKRALDGAIADAA